ncbi:MULTISPECIES: hypothetical protein [unclassified Gordonia (in: high G+C Gram-positive bacteria)]|uniref:hypothetical protein n=1 Tax=unclassified Gordonia (in: high G+C Gram-positive bacteria) TaxID=2657482 RepID=UPI001965622B|nr:MULTISPECIES: hypothetical protein [unclassified Gordonia (in: high G+C Gram-positive bacteria)]MBN0975108.1 hypothetical protein [Gordonia sp. BP-119]MBN0985281.1 hypothetical protein [Gordonia sp. BP-94]
MRVKLGPEQAAVQPDPLLREAVGWRAGLPTDKLWDRGRGVWKAKAAQILDSDLLLLAADGLVVLVGTINGVTKHGDRLAVTGEPIPDHPLIGKADPLHNRSSNPIAYGLLGTHSKEKNAMHLDDINAALHPWRDRPKVNTPLAACAALVCNKSEGAKLYVNDEIDCDHIHLVKDVNALVAAFERDELDPGWGELGDGNFGTFIGTRQAATVAGVQGWPSPPRDAH